MVKLLPSLEDLISADERVLWKDRVKDTLIAVTTKRLIVAEPARVRDVALHHIVSVEAHSSLTALIVGAVLFILGLALQEIGLALIIFGLIIAAWGWENRFVLVIDYGKRSIKIRDGPKLLEIAREIRRFTVKTET